jgi:hypothetical protein
MLAIKTSNWDHGGTKLSFDFSEDRERSEKMSQINGMDGGRDRDRTCDPLDVNEVLET